MVEKAISGQLSARFLTGQAGSPALYPFRMSVGMKARAMERSAIANQYRAIII
jgi:hypothetical protein